MIKGWRQRPTCFSFDSFLFYFYAIIIVTSSENISDVWPARVYLGCIVCWCGVVIFRFIMGWVTPETSIPVTPSCQGLSVFTWSGTPFPLNCRPDQTFSCITGSLGFLEWQWDRTAICQCHRSCWLLSIIQYSISTSIFVCRSQQAIDISVGYYKF